jgi:hypothetical protein
MSSPQGAEKQYQFALRLAVALLSQVPLHDLAIEVLTVAVREAAAQVLLEGNQAGGRAHEL